MRNSFTVSGDLTKIQAFHGDSEEYEILIDTQDLPLLLEIDCEWRVDNDHFVHYARSSVQGETLQMHRIITNAKDGEIVDHVNHDGIDNRRKNVRIVTYSENGLNRRFKESNNQSKVTNVYRYNNKGKWYAFMTINGKRTPLGRFDEKHEAAEAVEKFKEKNVPTSIQYAAAHGMVGWDEKLKRWV